MAGFLSSHSPNGLRFERKGIYHGQKNTYVKEEATRTEIDYQKGVAGALPGEQQSTGLLY